VIIHLMKPDTQITFEEFMTRALHDPNHGYYARRISSVGQRGDFTTAPMLSDAPAQAIARWAVRAMRETGCWDLIEIGPGEGTLSRDLLRFLPWLARQKTRLHLVETSAPLIARQKSLLGRRAVWHNHLSEALETCHGRAVIFSNELVDAFPVKRFKKTMDGWCEIAVSLDTNQRYIEILLPPAPLPDSSTFQENHPLGQCVEIHEMYRTYLREWMPRWHAGKILTIDYGNTAEKIYHRRPQGTLRAYLLQQRLEAALIYENPGRQDITADVNFTDLQLWSSPWVATHQLATFSEFLKRSKDHPFSEPYGAGEAFMVLEQTCHSTIDRSE
jgi:SAM-dependent MidA family methyltransferase